MKKTPYYELHITVVPLPSNTAQDEFAMQELLSQFDNWHFSKIDGDPELGAGVKLYATSNVAIQHGFNRAKAVLFMMQDELKRHGFNVVRKKIETVVLDEEVKP